MQHSGVGLCGRLEDSGGGGEGFGALWAVITCASAMYDDDSEREREKSTAPRPQNSGGKIYKLDFNVNHPPQTQSIRTLSLFLYL